MYSLAEESFYEEDTTLIATEKHDRRCRGMVLSSKHDCLKLAPQRGSQRKRGTRKTENNSIFSGKVLIFFYCVVFTAGTITLISLATQNQERKNPLIEYPIFTTGEISGQNQSKRPSDDVTGDDASSQRKKVHRMPFLDPDKPKYTGYARAYESWPED